MDRQSEGMGSVSQLELERQDLHLGLIPATRYAMAHPTSFFVYDNHKRYFCSRKGAGAFVRLFRVMHRLAGLARNAVQLFVYVTTVSYSSILKTRFMLLNKGYKPLFKVQWVLSNEIRRYIFQLTHSRSPSSFAQLVFTSFQSGTRRLVAVRTPKFEPLTMQMSDNPVHTCCKAQW